MAWWRCWPVLRLRCGVSSRCNYVDGGHVREGCGACLTPLRHSRAWPTSGARRSDAGATVRYHRWSGDDASRAAAHGSDAGRLYTRHSTRGTVTCLVRRALEPLLIVCGTAILLWVGVDSLRTSSYRRHVEATLRHASIRGIERTGPTSLEAGEPIGTLEVLRLGLSGVVVEGDDTSVLDRAIGHLPDTPLPWHAGNSALAAHRDALFRPLKGIRFGDLLRLRTPHGTFDYRVRDILIVKPEAVWVIETTTVSMLTLISCYPFTYLGHAPERFIVRAERVPTT